MRKILVADDEAAICELYADELSAAGYQVITTTDGAGLIEMIQQHGPDLVVLDIVIGKYNGLDILQDIRNSCCDMPVILCSAYSSFKYDLKSIAANDYIVKSVDLTELKIKINMALESVVPSLTKREMEKMAKQGGEGVRNIVGG
jgi:two-component system response regulator (stage 0 sporulation protein F)